MIKAIEHRMDAILKTIPAVAIPENFLRMEISPNTSPVIPARQVKGSKKKKKILRQESGKDTTPITKDATANPSEAKVTPYVRAGIA